ncbi:hypothetical protein T492DRAFT_882815 [Pavlovales sp. CCMP2436]|nr:hypothetical protein T492DRAFT_882815 [Pavlovales sp. CCMP2436]
MAASMQVSLRVTLVCAALHGAVAYSVVRPSVVARQRGHVALVSHRARVITLSSTAMPGGDGGRLFYRMLGVTPDASYDDVLDAFSALVKSAGTDAARVAELERARDGVLDARLKSRMSGQSETKREEVKTLKFARKYCLKPTPSHIFKVTTLFLGFAIVSFTSKMGDQLLLFSVIFGTGYVYAHGMPEPVKDDMGNILPTKYKPFFLAFVLIGFIALMGNIFASLYLSFLIPSKMASVSQVVTSFTCFCVWIGTLFLRTQDVDSKRAD